MFDFQLLIEASTPQEESPVGWKFEEGLLGRLLLGSPLRPLQSIQASLLEVNSGGNSWVGEFFSESFPTKPSVDSDKSAIWRVSMRCVASYSPRFNHTDDRAGVIAIGV